MSLTRLLHSSERAKAEVAEKIAQRVCRLRDEMSKPKPDQADVLSLLEDLDVLAADYRREQERFTTQG